jgi:uncharacterized repeat protein (TIGR01451 family)
MRRWLTLAAVAVLALAIPGMARAAGITLNRDIAPPQAVQKTVGTLNITWQVTFDTHPLNTALTITGPGGIQPVNHQPVAVGGAYPFTPGPTMPDGRYTITLEFYSQEIGATTPEATATATFDVATQIGTLQLVKYEDLNGDGQRSPNEPGVPGWQFNLTNPQGNPTTARTGADGTVMVPHVPAGIWNVAEVLTPGWVAISGLTGSVNVPPNGVGTYTAGNARPATLSGVVWVDSNRNGVQDSGEAPRGAVSITLAGTTGLGHPVRANGTTAGDGTYSFPGLLPGTYTVTEDVPNGFTPTTPTVLRNIPMISNVSSPNHNFGIARPSPARAAGGPTADLGVTKTGPATAKPGATIPYRITVRNTSKNTARNVILRDPVPARFILTGVPRGASVINGVVTWRLGDMKAGASKVVTMALRLDPRAPAGTYTNQAIASADNVGPKRAEANTKVARPKTVKPARTGGVTG